jgi:hypothetical protein
MNAFWKDPVRRELIVAAAIGFTWAVLGFALAAQGRSPIETSGSLPLEGRAGEGGEAGTRNAFHCRIHNYLPTGTANVGSGTLIDVTADRRHGLVLSCAHLFTEGTGRVIVEFPNGQTHGAKVLAVDRQADLSALEIATPADAAAQVAIDVAQGAVLTACGYGPTGQFRCISGPTIGTAASAGQESVQISGAVRSGDSGGGVFDAQGRLVAVVWGESGGVTYASTGGPLRQFLQRVMGRSFGGAQIASTGICPDGSCPLITPGSNSAAPAGRSPAAGAGGIGSGVGTIPVTNGACQCGPQWIALDARLAAIEQGKQDRGDYALRDDVVQLDGHHRQQHDALADRVEELVPLIAAAGRAALPVAATALGISGPAGWGVLTATGIGAWLIGRRRARAARREARVGKPDSELAPRASQPAPQEATAAAEGSFRDASVRIETQAPIERDDREARELLRLSQFEGRDPLQDALAGRLALDRLDALAESDADPQRARLADDLRRELRERFNDVAPTRFQVAVSDQHSAVS